jgi:hypothetical protein
MKEYLSRALVAHAYNPSYSGGRDQGSRPAQKNIYIYSMMHWECNSVGKCLPSMCKILPGINTQHQKKISMDKTRATGYEKYY